MTEHATESVARHADPKDELLAQMIDAVMNAPSIRDANIASDALAVAFPDYVRDLDWHYDAERFGRPCPVVGCRLEH